MRRNKSFSADCSLVKYINVLLDLQGSIGLSHCHCKLVCVWNEY